MRVWLNTRSGWANGKDAKLMAMLSAMELATKAGNVGVWIRDVATGKIWACQEMEKALRLF